MKITDVRATLVAIPYIDVLREERPEGYQTDIVEVEASDGLVGIGECGMGWIEPQIMLQMIAGYKTVVCNEDPFDIERIWGKLWSNSPHHQRYWPINRVISGIETAIWDLMAKACNKPLYKLIGGAVRDKVAFMPTLHRYPDIDRIVDEARDRVDQGFQCFQIKVGAASDNPDEDLAVVHALRDSLGPEIELVIDANSGWTPDTAIRMIRKMAEYDLFYVEDPVNNLDDMTAIRKRVQVPICAHIFGAGPTQSTLDVIKKEAADVVVIAHRNMGVQGVKKGAAIAEAADIPAILHSGIELGPALAIMVHLAASTPNSKYPNQLQYDLLTDDIIKGGRMEFIDGCLPVLEKPGIGVELDPEKMMEYTLKP